MIVRFIGKLISAYLATDPLITLEKPLHCLPE